MFDFFIYVITFALAAVGCLFLGAFTCEFFAALRAAKLAKSSAWPFGTGRIPMPKPETPKL